VLHGFQKQVRVQQKLRNSTIYEKTFGVIFPPGIQSGRKLRLSRQGIKASGYIPGDVIFTASDLESKPFVRKGENIEYTTFITKSEAEHGVDLKIPTFEGDDIEIRVPTLSQDQLNKSISGKGLPLHEKPEQRGKFIVKIETIDEKHKGKK